MTNKSPIWYNQITHLCEILERSDKNIELLHSIDKFILDEDKSLDCLFRIVVEGLCSTLQVAQGAFYLKSFDNIKLAFQNGTVNFPSQIILEESIKDRLNLNHEDDIISNQNESSLFAKSIKSFISIPIYAPIDSSEKRLFGILILGNTENNVPKTDPLSAFDNIDYARKVKMQFEIALLKYFQDISFKLLDHSIVSFFIEKINSKKLNNLINIIPQILPQFKPIKIKDKPEAQILFYYEKGQYVKEEHLSIKATTGNEIINTRVLIHESISGFLIEDRDLDYFLCNPKDYPKRYKSYLGNSAKKEILSELVIPIIFNGKIIAVFNLESEYENVFDEIHVLVLRLFAEKIAPVINDIKQSLDNRFYSQKAIFEGINKILTRISSLYRHGMVSPMGVLKLNTELLMQDHNTNVENRLHKIHSSIGEIDNFHDKFTKDISGFGLFGKLSVKKLIKETISGSNLDTLKEEEKISIKFDLNDYYVYCSVFIKQHFFNIINNSIHFLLEKAIMVPDFEGEISITSELVTDMQQEDVNKRCKLVFLDNGTGIDEEDVENVFNPNFSTRKNGSGLGLFAAKEYIESIGGRIFVESKKNVYFKLTIYIDIFNSKIHEDIIHKD